MQQYCCSYCWRFKPSVWQETRSNDFLGDVSNLAPVSSGFLHIAHALRMFKFLSRIDLPTRKLFHVFELYSPCLEQTREVLLVWIYNDVFCVVGIKFLHRTENTPCCSGISKNHSRFIVSHSNSFIQNFLNNKLWSNGASSGWQKWKGFGRKFGFKFLTCIYNIIVCIYTFTVKLLNIIFFNFLYTVCLKHFSFEYEFSEIGLKCTTIFM
jgi:hypothetical protein